MNIFRSLQVVHTYIRGEGGRDRAFRARLVRETEISG